MPGKQEFIEIYQEHICREGSAELLDYLENKCDFFTAPASARYHGSYAGGLCDHSVNVFRCLEAYLARDRVKEVYGVEYSMESVAIASLLHDVCKIDCYRAGTRNVKDEDAYPTTYELEAAQGTLKFEKGYTGEDEPGKLTVTMSQNAFSKLQK